MYKLPLWVACAAIALLPVAASAHDRQGNVERQTRFGKIVGVDDSRRNGTYAWKGVPFAQPPVGELRWKAPVDPDRWRRTLKTQQFGNACVQYGRIYGPAPTTATTRASAPRSARRWAARTACT